MNTPLDVSVLHSGNIENATFLSSEQGTSDPQLMSLIKPDSIISNQTPKEAGQARLFPSSCGGLADFFELLAWLMTQKVTRHNE